MDASRYPVPAGESRHEEVIERSRFITHVARVDSGDAAHAFIAGLNEEFADATHNCHAFLVGPPGSSACVGMSDAGEPHGTAGRPMLHALTHSGLGDVAVVVTRYFGGRKLGRGGLVRAYGGCVAQALLRIERVDKVRWSQLALAFPYAHLAAIQRIYTDLGVEVLAETFGEGVAHRVRLPESARAGFLALVCDRTRGQVVPQDEA